MPHTGFPLLSIYKPQLNRGPRRGSPDLTLLPTVPICGFASPHYPQRQGQLAEELKQREMEGVWTSRHPAEQKFNLRLLIPMVVGTPGSPGELPSHSEEDTASPGENVGIFESKKSAQSGSAPGIRGVRSHFLTFYDPGLTTVRLFPGERGVSTMYALWTA